MRLALLAALTLFLAGCASEPSPPGEPTPTPGTPTPTPPETTPTPTTPPGPDTTTPPRPPQDEARFPGCEGEGPIVLTHAPMRAEDFTSILPYGLVVGAHVTPIDHMYFGPLPGSERDSAEVRAVADGVIYDLQPRDIRVDTNTARQREWRLDIAHTCTFTSYLDLLTSITPELEQAWNDSKTHGNRLSIPITAGQLLGRIGAQTLDFGVYDYTITLPGLLIPEHYDREPWKIHTVDPYPHFAEEPRTMLLSKSLRQIEPRAGKIDHDIDGRLIGNWFATGTNGYAGDGRWDYWEGHLSIAPDYLDPTLPIYSTGNWSGEARNYAIRNSIDPANITMEDGPVKLELAPYTHRATNRQAHGLGPDGIQPGDDIQAEASGASVGTVLVQLVEERVLKVEHFPGKTADEVDTFTDKARTYER